MRVRLTDTQFLGLKIGDKVLLRSGTGEHRVEAEVTVEGQPDVVVWVRLDKITHQGEKAEVAEGEKRVAGSSELYLVHIEPLY